MQKLFLEIFQFLLLQINFLYYFCFFAKNIKQGVIIMNFQESQTAKNLARAFAGECQAGARYQFIAKQAEQEGQIYIKATMKKLAKHEMAHAKLFWDLIQKYTKGQAQNIEITAGFPFRGGSLAEMLHFSSHNEKSENTTIYPSFSKIADDEGFDDVSNAFKMIAGVEHDHYEILNGLYLQLSDKTLYCRDENKQWKCSQCGFGVYEKCAPNPCPLCSSPQGSYEICLNCEK